MATQTPKLGLDKLEPTDRVGRDQFNKNMDILDDKVGALGDVLGDLEGITERQDTLEEGQASLAGRVSAAELNVAKKENKADKGQPDGYASLDSDGKVPITQLPANIKEMRVVPDIAARDALEPYDGLRVRVLDATGDPTVAEGWAEYVWDEAATAWIKLAEKESLDIVLDWDNIQDIPQVLTDLSDLDGKLLYKGSAIYTDVRAISFIGGESEIVYPWAGSVQQIKINCAEVRSEDLEFAVEVQAKDDYVAQAANWRLVGGAQLILPEGEVYKEFAVTALNIEIAAGDVIRASTVGDDTGVTFTVIIQND
ncbi:hypothetical protein HSX37_16100|uniref:Uncharacterized protein n=1 Tax=Dendrosporobacter quercicolus TaxID=146817 RepID=A0A1G9ZPX0_9FIRM|nr:hypothetical protein [Dendrosporobacter quercicolus]NSL49558.1 hypothetical protein [Dendrosporobacter quercicolus DSM 1736]SDN22673.1 hypothetical protein SAMN04488502_11513 [Dendrosporobacter quercicolus]